MKFFAALIIALCLSLPAFAAGTTPLALQQEIDQNGQPLAGCLLYFFQAGTVATPQQAYSDFGLTTALPNPVSCDQTGRIPMHWLADGLIHIRLTDSTGVVVIDTTLQSLGPSSGGGGGGGSIDPTTIAATGDIKFRPTNEGITGWVKLNAQTIGSAASGATGRANADTQNLFVYLWTNCTNAHCPVPGGRGVSAVADFNANKQITVYDMRDSILVGRDCMENSCLGGLLASNVTSGGGDGVDTPAAFGGKANRALAPGNLPTVNFVVSIPAGQFTHNHGATTTGPSNLNAVGVGFGGGGSGGWTTGAGANANFTTTVNNGGPGAVTGSAASGGFGTAFAVMNPFKLGSYYIKL